jgi:hypothetical protein
MKVTMKMQVSTYRRWYQIVMGCVCIYTDEFIEFLMTERVL